MRMHLLAAAWMLPFLLLHVAAASASAAAAGSTDPAAAFRAANQAIEMADWQAAEIHLRVAASAWPEHPRIRLLRGIVAWHRGELDLATEQLQHCLDSDEAPLRARALYYLVLTHSSQGEQGQAAAILQRLLHEHPDSPESRRLQQQAATLQTPQEPPTGASWRLRGLLLGLYDDNPAQLHETEVIAERPEPDTGLQASLIAGLIDTDGHERYRLLAAARRYREARVLDSLVLQQDLRLFRLDRPDGEHAVWVESSLHWLDDVPTRHSGDLRWSSLHELGQQSWLRIDALAAVDDFLQQRNRELDALRLGGEGLLGWQPAAPALERLLLQVHLSHADTRNSTYSRWWAETVASAAWRLGPQWELQLDAHAGLVHYPHQQTDSGADRQDLQWGLELRCQWSAPGLPGVIMAGASLSARESNDDLFDYDRRQILLGWRFEH